MNGDPPAPSASTDRSSPVDDLNRDWPGRAEFFRSFAGELDQEMVDQFDAAHTEEQPHG